VSFAEDAGGWRVVGLKGADKADWVWCSCQHDDCRDVIGVLFVKKRKNIIDS
jgi:hypothetical protein